MLFVAAIQLVWRASYDSETQHTLRPEHNDAALVRLPAVEYLGNRNMRAERQWEKERYHLLNLGLDIAQAPFKVRNLGCAFLAVGTIWKIDDAELAHGGRRVDHKHGHSVLSRPKWIVWGR